MDLHKERCTYERTVVDTQIDKMLKGELDTSELRNSLEIWLGMKDALGELQPHPNREKHIQILSEIENENPSTLNF